MLDVAADKCETGCDSEGVHADSERKAAATAVRGGGGRGGFSLCRELDARRKRRRGGRKVTMEAERGGDGRVESTHSGTGGETRGA